MTPEDLKQRPQRFAIDVIRFCATLPNGAEYAVMRRQLVRCATSVGANYRSACRAQSSAHFISKLSIVEEEADESMYWLELVRALGQGEAIELQRLHEEANQIMAIMVASKRTVRSKRDGMSA